MPDHCNHNHPDFEEPTMTTDENGRDIHEHYWLKHCHNDKGLDGQRITCARALAIAHEILHTWLADGDLEDLLMYRRDIEIAAGVLSAIRGQRGCEHYDPAIHSGHMTELMDVIIYG